LRITSNSQWSLTQLPLLTRAFLEGDWRGVLSASGGVNMQGHAARQFKNVAKSSRLKLVQFVASIFRDGLRSNDDSHTSEFQRHYFFSTCSCAGRTTRCSRLQYSEAETFNILLGDMEAHMVTAPSFEAVDLTMLCCFTIMSRCFNMKKTKIITSLHQSALPAKELKFSD
jgi:hypothetical protein